MLVGVGDQVELAFGFGGGRIRNIGVPSFRGPTISVLDLLDRGIGLNAESSVWVIACAHAQKCFPFAI